MSDIDGAMRFLKRQYPVSDEALSAQVAHMRDEHFLPEEIGKLDTRPGTKMVILTQVVTGSMKPTCAHTPEECDDISRGR